MIRMGILYWILVILESDPGFVMNEIDRFCK